MKNEVKERQEYIEFLIGLGIGQMALIKKWLQKYRIPYKEEDILWSFNKDGYLKSFEISLDKEKMVQDFVNETLTPEFVKSGKITISVILSE
jgi:hypothetical protein